MGLESWSEILLIIRVVYAVLGLVFLHAMNCTIGSDWEDGGGRQLVEVLRSDGPAFKAVQVLGFCVV